MEPEYVLLIVAGGVFALMLVIYSVVEFKRSRAYFHDKEQLEKSYNSDNLKKMEYDVAFYDKATLKFDFNLAENEQVTLEEILDQGEDRSVENAQKAIFSQIEDDGVTEIKGNYRPVG